MFHEQIAKGIRFLDEKEPHWLASILPEMLDLEDPYYCVLGLANGTFHDALADYGIAPGGTYTPVVDSWCIDHGFVVPDGEEDYYPTLTDEWTTAVEELQLTREIVVTED